MKHDSEQEAANVESVERRRLQSYGLGINGCREKVDGIPDTPLLKNSVQTCEDRHCDTAGQPALNAGRNRIGFEWKQCSWKIRSKREPRHLPTLSRNGSVFLNHWHFNMFFVRQDISKPSNASGDDQYDPQQADGSARNKAGKQQRDTKSKDDWPSRRCG